VGISLALCILGASGLRARGARAPIVGPAVAVSDSLDAFVEPFVVADRMDTVSTAWPHGGDYVGLAADGDGVFHPVWTDTRSGKFRVYTAAVRAP